MSESKFNTEQLENIKLLHLQGNSARKIAILLDEYRITISNQLKKMGIYKSNNNNTKNIDFFKKIDTEEKAYWLGFIYADGCIVDNFNSQYRYRVNISSIDKDHLSKIAKIFDRKIYTRINKTTNLCDHETTIYRLDISNKNIWEDLQNLDIQMNKSNSTNTNVLNFIPDELKCHFIRGVFDGDGSIVKDNINNAKSKFSISGQIYILKKIQEILVLQIGVSENIINKKTQGEVYQLQYGGLNQVNKIYRYLYMFASIYLERKKNKFEEILKVPWQKIKLSPTNVHNLIIELSKKINKKYENIYAIPRGGCIIGVYLSHLLEIPLVTEIEEIDPLKTLVVDDILDSGITLKSFKDKNFDLAVLHYKPRASIIPTYYAILCPNWKWVIYPWEKLEETPNREI